MSKPEESSLATDSVFSGQFPFHVFYGVLWFCGICFWALRFLCLFECSLDNACGINKLSSGLWVCLFGLCFSH